MGPWGGAGKEPMWAALLDQAPRAGGWRQEECSCHGPGPAISQHSMGGPGLLPEQCPQHPWAPVPWATTPICLHGHTAPVSSIPPVDCSCPPWALLVQQDLGVTQQHLPQGHVGRFRGLQCNLLKRTRATLTVGLCRGTKARGNGAEQGEHILQGPTGTTTKGQATIPETCGRAGSSCVVPR